MKLIALTLLIAFSTYNLVAQKSHDISLLKTQSLKNDASQFSDSFLVPFNKIEVMDLRFDTSKIGYAIYNSKNNHTRFVTAGGVEGYLNKRLNDYFKANLDAGSSNTLVIVLKKLWLEYGSTNMMLRSKDVPDESKWSISNRNAVCLADIDAFVKTGESYQALLRLTHNFTIERVNDYSDCHLLLKAFDSLVRSIRTMDVVKVTSSKKKFTVEDLNINYRKRFDIPVLTAPQFNRGIYYSFDDFRNNKPSHPDFTFKTFEISTEVTIMEAGHEKTVTDYWGFCDGKDLYVKPRYLTFKALRQGNTFDFLGSLEGKNTPFYIPVPGTFLVIKTNTTLINFIPLQVDMETGKVY